MIMPVSSLSVFYLCMKKNLLSLSSHIAVFVAIEILFVFLILHEFPEITLFEKLGIVHISYRILLVIAGLIREKLVTYRKKFLATYVPVVYHIAGHIYVGVATVESIQNHTPGDSHSIFWMITATIALGIIIFIGEWLLHRKVHCDTCHQEVHQHCKE
jgi:hypothetical protein